MQITLNEKQRRLPSASQAVRYRLCLQPQVALLAHADRIRNVYCGRQVFIRGLLEFSNYCMRNCLYCGLRRGNTKLIRYRLPPDQIVSMVRAIYNSGLRTVVLQSGDDHVYSRACLCDIISRIKTLCPGMAVTLSVGERPLQDYRAFREYGADRYLLRHEARNERLYRSLHPGQSLAARMTILEYLKKIGFQVGVGNIVGLPGQKPKHLIEDILFMKEFCPDMIGIGPFIPQRHTPLADFSSPALSTVLRYLATVCIETGVTLMPATTALATLAGPGGYRAGLNAGCNVIMVNFTPYPVRKHYRIYDNKIAIGLAEVLRLVRALGRIPSGARGDSFRKPKQPNRLCASCRA